MRKVFVLFIVIVIVSSCNLKSKSYYIIEYNDKIDSFYTKINDIPLCEIAPTLTEKYEGIESLTKKDLKRIRRSLKRCDCKTGFIYGLYDSYSEKRIIAGCDSINPTRYGIRLENFKLIE
ncbi:hypothetical protein [Salibacter halophilus]|uniref:Lipoprotein n=1 Tax=Salibacter halophilus TaxID=1803916 RepID=A0A6N6M5K9_9FLAO|nr:hypothetical protein [Salibacter halophilus]KAB1064899.1 hypothetical protein F3059_05975 [Salibacter halophilus]